MTISAISDANLLMVVPENIYFTERDMRMLGNRMSGKSVFRVRSAAPTGVTTSFENGDDLKTFYKDFQRERATDRYISRKLPWCQIFDSVSEVFAEVQFIDCLRHILGRDLTSDEEEKEAACIQFVLLNLMDCC